MLNSGLRPLVEHDKAYSDSENIFFNQITHDIMLVKQMSSPEHTYCLFHDIDKCPPQIATEFILWLCPSEMTQ